MKILLWLLLVVLAATLIPLSISAGNGYVLLVQPPYRIELSTSLFLLLIVLGFITVYALMRLIFFTLRLPENVREFKQKRREKEAHAALMECLTAQAEGSFAKAAHAADKALQLGCDPKVATLLAARCAHKQKNYGQRDYYLAECERLAPEGSVARLLSHAEFLLDQGRVKDAAEKIASLKHLEPHHPELARLEKLAS